MPSSRAARPTGHVLKLQRRGIIEYMRFRGEVVTSFVSRGWPGGTLDIEGDLLTLRTLLSDPVVVRRDDIEAVEFRRMRFPLLWCTFTVMRGKDGYLRQMFVAFRSSKLRGALESFGWRVEQGPKVSGRQVLFAPRP